MADKLGLFVATAEIAGGAEAAASVAEMIKSPAGPRALKIFLVAGEHSGDALGAKLIAAIKHLRDGPISFSGVGGEEMAHEGFSSLFPIEDVAVMGPMSILPRLPRIVRRVYQTVDAALAFAPDVVVIIDSPEFTHPIAKRIRKRAPRYSDRRLRESERLGVAAGTRQAHAPLHRSRVWRCCPSSRTHTRGSAARPARTSAIR